MQKVHKEEILPGKIFFYMNLHQNKIAFNELTRLAKKRIALLKSIETLKDARIMDMDPIDDEISHFACRLICSTIPWAFNWLLLAETKLLKERIRNLKISEIKQFFFTVLMKKYKNLVFTDSAVFINQNTEFSIQNTEENSVSDVLPIKVHFSKAPDILRSTSEMIIDGYFTLSDELISKIIINEYHSHLYNSLSNLRSNNSLKTDDRFLNISSELFTEQKSDSNQLNLILKKSPPCMNVIIERMRNEKHLKYNDRVILIRYLKSTGLSVNDCIEFFKNNFSCDTTRFEREFVYAIRHNYGLEGKRADYKTFSCMQIIGMSACPFTSNQNISDYLKTRNLIDIEDTLKEETVNRNFTKACTKLCEHTNKKENIELINTPVAYFKHSK